MEKLRKNKRLSLERIPSEHQPSDMVRENVREEAFRSIIFSELNENLENNLAAAEFTDAEIEEIEQVIAKLTFEDAMRVFSVPYETAVRKFRMLREKVDSGDIQPRDIPGLLIEEAERYGFAVGYHNSPVEIKPDKEDRWFIKPTERDHRDGDLAKAYFATTYKTLYRKGTPRYMYIVRTLADNTKTDGNWSRSNGMSIITSVPIDRVDAWVDRFTQESEAKMEKKEDGAHFGTSSSSEELRI